jgi:hypothetical protein
MKKILLLFYLLFFLSFYVSAQKNYNFYSGYILDLETKNAIKFANLSVEGINYITFTNENGYFEWKLPKSVPTTALVTIQHLSYETYKTTLYDILKNIKIYLTPNTITLQEVTLRNESPLGMMKEVIKKLPESHPTEASLRTIFYRENNTISESRDFVSKNGVFTEGIFQVHTPIYFEFGKGNFWNWYSGIKSKAIKIRFYDMSHPILPSSENWYIKQNEKLGVLECINWKSYAFFQENLLKDYSFNIKDSVFFRDGNNISVITFESKNKKENYEKGEVWIDDNFCIVKLLVKYVKRPKKEKLVQKLKNKTESYSLRVVDYKRIGEKYFPSFINYSNLYIYKAYSGRGDTISIRNSLKNIDIFFLENVVTETAPDSLENKSIINYYTQADNYEQDFWENYNAVPALNVYQIWGLDTSYIPKYNHAVNILENSWKRCQTLKNGKYSIRYTNIYEDSTSVENHETFFERRKFGSYGSKFHTIGENEEMIFDGKKMVFINHKEKTIQDSIYIWDMDRGKKNITDIYNNNALFVPFTRTDAFFVDIIKNKIDKSQFTKPSIEIFKGDTCYIIKHDYANPIISSSKEVLTAVLSLYIRKRDFLPVKMVFDIKFINFKIKKNAGNQVVTWEILKIDSLSMPHTFNFNDNYKNYKVKFDSLKKTNNNNLIILENKFNKSDVKLSTTKKSKKELRQVKKFERFDKRMNKKVNKKTRKKIKNLKEGKIDVL